MLCCLTACSDSVTSQVRLLTPRPFGYVLGDTLRHQVLITTDNGVKLDKNSLPKPGQLNRWLQLNALNAHEESIGGGHTRYRIDLTYQVFYAPLEVKMLTIPAFNVVLQQGQHHAEQAVPAWSFTLSPLRELAVRKDETGEYMRPDALVPLLSSDAAWTNALIAFFMMLLSGGYLMSSYGYLARFNQKRVFKPAYQRLLRLTDKQLDEGFALVHGALNQIYGQPLFQAQLAEFFYQHAEYQKLKTDLAEFFDLSNRYFFGTSTLTGHEVVTRLQQLCLQCARIEQGEA
ncbi:hypothetical protein VZ94_11845 [Methylocucumis oryzae]|uniref:Nonribosomal peptide synthetase MxaA n=1 Tax=Methylocucumis oryzae TaxID=1632867 RepID=A0A0F3IHU2_9GAMM|nr:hypothetical protein VZ94_11845 [Methylocucumis oryzae]